jgi:hypothetical protein
MSEAVRDVELAVELVLRQFLDWRKAIDAGIVDQHAEAAESLFSSPRKAFSIFQSDSGIESGCDHKGAQVKKGAAPH